MFVSVGLCILGLAVPAFMRPNVNRDPNYSGYDVVRRSLRANAQQVDSFPHPAQPSDVGSTLLEGDSAVRRRRGVFSIIRSVLKEAEFIVATGNRRHLIYVKRGGIKQAKKDFQSLQPINVQTQKEGTSIVGKAGDYEVEMNAAVGHPILNIKSKRRTADGTPVVIWRKIHYYKNKRVLDL